MVTRRTVLLSTLLAPALLVAGSLAALGTAPAVASDHHSRPDHSPAVISLPNGFAPEDIARGRHSTFYVGSLSSGAIYRGSFRTGTGSVLVPGSDGPTTGLFVERRGHHADRLWAAGGPTGQARVYDARTGTLLRTYQLAAPGSGTFVSDAVATRHAVYYTDAFVQQMYVLPLGRHGALPDPGAVRTVPLAGDVVYQHGPNIFNLNGIVSVDHTLISAQTVTGQLFTLDPRTGSTRQIPLVDADGRPTDVSGADGFVARGHTLVLARNFAERIAIVRLRHHASSARLVANLADPLLDIPSSVEVNRGRIFALNARFGTAVTPDTTYDVVRVPGPDHDDDDD
jgi:hypothetical protein